MEFKGQRKRKYEAVEEFVKYIRKIQKETKMALEKAQEEMKRYADKIRSRGEEYQVGDLVMLSMKVLKQQMKKRRSQKLIEYFDGSYKIKGIISTNVVELVLLSIV